VERLRGCACYIADFGETEGRIMAFINRMAGQDYIDETRRYLDYLEEHLRNVQTAFTEVSNACDGMSWVGDDYSWHTLREDIIYHDLSKFSKEEFTQYRDTFFPVSDADKGNCDFDLAWENHKEENHHHHENAENFLDIVHMVVDWTAMGYKFGDTAQQYYERNRDKISLADDHRVFMLEIFDRLEAYRTATRRDEDHGGD